MKLRFVGMICPECGDETRFRAWYAIKPDGVTWLGRIRLFRCYPCKLEFLLFFDAQKAFKTVITEQYHEDFVNSCGGPRRVPAQWDTIDWSPDDEPD